jgi:hypothetical protein
MADAILMQLRLKGGTAEVRVNDIPVNRTVDDEIVNVTVPVPEFLVNGENTLKLYAAPTDPDNPGDFSAKARIAGFTFGDTVDFDEGEEFALLEWTEENAGRPVGQRFDYATDHKWVWENAPKITLSADVRARLDAFTARMQAAFSARDPGPINAAREVFYKEIARAYPPPLLARTAEEFADDLKSEDEDAWGVKLFEPSPDNYRLVADGRLVDLVGPDNIPLVGTIPGFSGAPPDEAWNLPLRVAIKGDEVIVVR